MNNKEFSVEILNNNHIDQISNIWIKSLPNNLKSIIGRKLINKYIEEFFKTEENLGIGLFKSDELIGFVFFGNDEKIMAQIFKKNLIFITCSFFSYFLKFKFLKLYYYLDVLIFLTLSKIKKKKYDNTTELLIISINNNYQNKGLGSYLLKTSFEKNNEYFKKFKNVLVMTLKNTPENIEFYKKNNFEVVYSIYGRVFLRLNF